MKAPHRTVLAIMAAFVLLQPALANQTMQFGEDSKIRMIRLVGEDDGTFYVVYCKNGREGSVAIYNNPKQTCISPPKQCRVSWDLRLAAEELCQ